MDRRALHAVELASLFLDIEVIQAFSRWILG